MPVSYQNLIIVGDDSFQQAGAPQWTRSMFELDQLRVPYRGGIDKLSAYLDSLVNFQPSAIDPNMFLFQFAPDQHKQFPLVEHTYIGRKGGVLPPGQHEDFDQVLSASSQSSSLSWLIINIPVDIQFYAPTTRLTWISNMEGQPGPNSPLPSVPNGDIRIISARWGNNPNIAALVGNNTLLNLAFSEIVIHTTRSIEMVPAKYWKNTYDITKTLIPFIVNPPDGDLHLDFNLYLQDDQFPFNADQSTEDIIQLFDSVHGTSIGLRNLGVTGLQRVWSLHGPLATGTSFDSRAITASNPTGGVTGGAVWRLFLDLKPNGNGTWDIKFAGIGPGTLGPTSTLTTISPVAFPTVHSTVAMDIDQVKAGVVPSGGSGYAARMIAACFVGTASLASDIFAGILQPAVFPAVPKIVPPWTTNVGGAMNASSSNLGANSNILVVCHAGQYLQFNFAQEFTLG